MFVRLLFFQARKKPRVRLTERNCADGFGSRHSLHELELKLRGQEIRDTGIGKFWGYHVYLFWSYLSSFCNLFQEDIVLSEATVLLLSKGPVAKSLSEKQNSQGRTHEVYVSTYTMQAHLRGYGIAKTLTIATFFWTPPLSTLAFTKKGCLRRVLTDVLVDFRSGRLLELTVWLSLVGVCGQRGLSTQPPVCLEQG